MPDASVPDRPVGVLALQGDFAAHGRVIESLGGNWVPVRNPGHLRGVSGLVLPGGESTTMLRALREEGLWDSLNEFSSPMLATCAGLILLASEVSGPSQPSFGRIDVAVRRNAYGRQNESFIGRGRFREAPVEELELVFIRAPRIERIGPSVRPLITLDGEPVMVEEGLVTGCAFHPELSDSPRIHARFLATCHREETA